MQFLNFFHVFGMMFGVFVLQNGAGVTVTREERHDYKLNSKKKKMTDSDLDENDMRCDECQLPIESEPHLSCSVIACPAKILCESHAHRCDNRFCADVYARYCFAHLHAVDNVNGWWCSECMRRKG